MAKGASDLREGRVASQAEAKRRLARFLESGPVCRETGEPFRGLRVKPVRLIYQVAGRTVTLLAVYREKQSIRLYWTMQ